MGKTLALVACCAVVATPFALADEGNPSTAACTASENAVPEAKKIARTAYRRAKWRDRTPVKPHQRAMLTAYKKCANDAGQRQIKRFVAKRKERFHLYRLYREVATVRCQKGAFGYWAWIGSNTCVCIGNESGFSWGAANGSSSARGPYQLLDTWDRPWPVHSFRDKMRHHISASKLGPQSWVAPGCG